MSVKSWQKGDTIRTASKIICAVSVKRDVLAILISYSSGWVII